MRIYCKDRRFTPGIRYRAISDKHPGKLHNETIPLPSGAEGMGDKEDCQIRQSSIISLYLYFIGGA